MGGKARDPNKAAMKAQKEQMARLDRLSLPQLEEYMLQNPELVGLLDAEQLGSSAQEDISLDPALRDKQMQALSALQERADQGITDTDKYQMEQLLGDVASQEQSRQKQIENQMAQQGMDSSGAALAAKLQNKQSSSNNARQQAMQMAAQGQQNRQQALQALGSQAGQMESADYGRQANLASARDTISRYNAENKQGVNQMNLAARQAIENQRANTANQQAQVGNQIAQQNFGNQMAKATGQGSVANSMSNIAGNTPQGPSGIQQLATIGGGIAGAFAGGPAGIVGGAQAGSSIGGLFADGGVAYADGGLTQEQQKVISDDEKQRAAFKKKYMKSIHDEVLASNKKEGLPKYSEGGTVPPYLMSNEEMIKKAQNAPKIGIGNDMTSDEVQTYEDAKPLMEEKKGMSGEDLFKSLSTLGSLMGQKEKSKQPLKLGDFSMQAPQNTMTPIQAQQYSNPFAAADGAVINNLVDPSELPQRGGSDFASPDDRQSAVFAALMQELQGQTNPQEIPMDKQLPAYKCGGVHYASDGMGDIIDSGMESYADDRVDAKVNDGEAILNVPQQQRMMDLLRGKISLTELGNDDIVEGVPKDYRDDLHEKLEDESEGNESDEDIRLEGLNKLIKLLGR